jgi:DMSO reductase family type II enzyme heme b subunit
MAGPREKPVQDLIAEGPGTLTAASSTTSDGRGERSEDGWTVVITRLLPEGFDTAAPAQVAFAVWEGSQEEVGARKMRTPWITLTKLEKP